MCLESISVRERTNVSREYKYEKEQMCLESISVRENKCV